MGRDRNLPIEVKHSRFVVGLMENISILLDNCFLKNKNFNNIQFHVQHKELIESNKVSAELIMERLSHATKEIQDTLDDDNSIIESVRQLMKSVNGQCVDENGYVLVKADQLIALSKQLNDVVGEDIIALDRTDPSSLLEPR